MIFVGQFPDDDRILTIRAHVLSQVAPRRPASASAAALRSPMDAARRAAEALMQGWFGNDPPCGRYDSTLKETDALLRHAASLQGLAWTLPAGQTALSVKLNFDQAVGGLIQPGDRVNINCTTERQTKILLSHVRVVAVDSQIWDPESSSVPSSKSKDGLTDSVLVTFSLTPREGALLSLAMDKGHLQLALTSPLDSTSPSALVVELIDLR